MTPAPGKACPGIGCPDIKPVAGMGAVGTEVIPVMDGIPETGGIPIGAMAMGGMAVPGGTPADVIVGMRGIAGGMPGAMVLGTWGMRGATAPGTRGAPMEGAITGAAAPGCVVMAPVDIIGATGIVGTAETRCKFAADGNGGIGGAPFCIKLPKK